MIAKEERVFTCTVCKNEFVSARKYKFCSDKCRKIQRDWKVTKKYICPTCGKEFERLTGTRQNREIPAIHYCSPQCRNRHRNLKHARTCVVCGKSFKAIDKRRKVCSKKCKSILLSIISKRRESTKKRNKKTFTCRECGKEYIPKKSDRTTYCSRECCFKAKAQAKIKGKRIQRGATCRVYFKQCAVCNKWFTARSKATACCSNDDCKRKDRNSRSLIYAPKHIKDRIGKTIKCKECGKEYVYQYGMKKRGFCSLKCGKAYNGRITKAKRRAREKDTQIERVDPIAVFERDGWKCRICGKSTPRASRGTYKSNAPELDHIIPLALGGWHTWQNVQCACRSCNSKKGINKIKKGEQLFLI